MIGEQVLGSEQSQTRCALQLVGTIVPPPMTVQLILAGERSNAHVAHEPRLNAMDAFDVIVQLVRSIEHYRAVPARKLNSLVDDHDVLL